MSEDSGGGACPEEVRRVYPHRVSISQAIWRSYFDKAEREIGILTDDGRFLVHDAELLRVLAEKAAAGVNVRIIVRDPAGWVALAEAEGVRLVACQAAVGNAVYRADDELLVHPYILGVPAPAAPVMHLHKAGNGDLFRSYLEGFEHLWMECALSTTEREATCQRPSG
jgi:phosphatidylserine/phosphatidylglycerophosphate/cardiolipin synthase-like enzyme